MWLQLQIYAPQTILADIVFIAGTDNQCLDWRKQYKPWIYAWDVEYEWGIKLGDSDYEKQIPASSIVSTLRKQSTHWLLHSFK